MPADKPHGPAAAARDPVQPARDQVNLRRRGLVQGLIGHKVSVSTTDLHHVVGRLKSLRPAADGDDSLVIMVNNEEVHVRLWGVVRIHEADSALAEYTK